jgi:hypothetical protein
MNNTDPKLFGEWGTMNEDGVNITPRGNQITSFGGTFETILTDEQAANYTYDMMFKNNIEKPWDPAALTAQVAAPKNVKFVGSKLVWSADKDIKTFVVFKNGQIFGIANTTEFAIDDVNATYSVSAANEMGGLSEAALAPVFVTLSDAGYATFYDSENCYDLPEGLKAYVITNGTEDKLTYVQLNDVIPVGTAVMLKGEKNRGKKYELKASETKIGYVGQNLLVGSDAPTLTYSLIKMPCLFYKLAWGPSNTKYAHTFGWYWGAENGEAFEIEGRRAWLAIPQTVARGVRMYSLVDNDDNATGLELPTTDSNEMEDIYNLNGQRVAAPTKGLYIKNNKKVIIK